MKRVLVTGAKGQLGSELIAYLRNFWDVVGADRAEMDLADEASIRAFLEQTKPDAIIHAGAYTAVDRAEDERDLCLKVNSESVKVLADHCQKEGIILIFISSDYVFDGEKEGLYLETDATNPKSVYGLSKVLGENYIKERLDRYFIVRISWVFGNGHNFVNTMLKFGAAGKPLKIVADQVGSPTYAADLVPVLCQMLESDKYGTYHVTNDGFCSWYEFAAKIFEAAGLEADISPVAASEYPTKASRPQNSRLSKSKLLAAGFGTLPTWEDALGRFLR